MQPTISRTDFEALVRRAGLSLTPEQAGGIHQGWAYVEKMLERVRGKERDRAAEPAHIFEANAFFGEGR